jgi:YD repeat-containing protein
LVGLHTTGRFAAAIAKRHKNKTTKAPLQLPSKPYLINQITFSMRKHLLVALLAAATLASCKKDKVEDNNNGGGIPDPVPPTTKLLRKITETTDGNATVYNLTYNTNKLLTSVKSSDNSDITTFTYDGNGNVTKVESLDNESHNVYEYVYENGIPERATFKSYEINGGVETLVQDDILHYEVEGGKVTKINMDMILQQQEINFVLSYDGTGNLIKIQTDGSTAYTAEFTYGNKKPILPKVFKYVMDQAGYSVNFFAKNELISQRYDFPGTENDSEHSTQYTYDANGYALTSTDGNTQITYEYQ